METIIIVAIGVVILIAYTIYRVSFWRKRVRIETKEAQDAVSTSFRDLREKIERNVEMLDNKPGLSQEEKEIRDKLQEALDRSEEVIQKEISDIEKEID